MGAPAQRRAKSKPLVSSSTSPTVGAIKQAGNGDLGLSGPGVSSCVPQRNAPHMTAKESLASLSNEELDAIFCVAVKHHFEQEKVWVPSVLRTMPLLEGINDKTGRPCRIYVRPGKRILMVETLL